MAVGPRTARRKRRRRLLGIELGGAAVFCAIAVAVAVGISQAASSPACASVWAVPAAAQHPGRALAPGSPLAQTSGEATHYVLQTGDGNCSYPDVGAGQLYVALSPGAYGSAAACGSYLRVTGPDGSVTAEVVDQCPECQAGHIDLSEAAFARIAPLAAGLVPVTYHTIADPPLPAPLSMRVKEGSSAYWLALLPIGTGNALTSVQVSSPAHGWQDLAHASYNYWLATSGMGAGPFTVRLTDVLGNQATLTGITLTPGAVQATGTSMYGAGSVPAPAAPAASTAPTAAAATATHPAPARTTASPAQTSAAIRSAASASPVPVSPSPSC